MKKISWGTVLDLKTYHNKMQFPGTGGTGLMGVLLSTLFKYG